MRFDHYRLCEENPHADVKLIIGELSVNLQLFDQKWAKFEQVSECMQCCSSTCWS
jgi:hypothetical protein